MNKERFLFTSESVTEGHPDKVADQISDAVLDAILEQDPSGHVACETFIKTGVAIIGVNVLSTTSLMPWRRVIAASRGMSAIRSVGLAMVSTEGARVRSPRAGRTASTPSRPAVPPRST